MHSRSLQGVLFFKAQDILKAVPGTYLVYVYPERQTGSEYIFSIIHNYGVSHTFYNTVFINYSLGRGQGKGLLELWHVVDRVREIA